MGTDKSQQTDRPKLKAWEWSQHWLWFTAFAILGVVLSRWLDSRPSVTTLSDFGLAYLCVAASQLLGIHFLEKRLNGPTYMQGYATFADWILVNGIRALIYAIAYFVGAFLVLGFLSGKIGFDPRR